MSKANVDQDSSERDGIAASMARCEISAPFDGEISSLAVHLHETPERGSKTIHILDSTKLEVDMIVPSNWLRWLRKGNVFEMQVDELGTTASVEITRIADQVDAVSGTIKVVGSVLGENRAIRPGMSGSLTLQRKS